jgi:hypothetical protein
MWTSKIGNVAEHLRLGLSNEGALLDVDLDLTGPGGSGAPQFRCRLRNVEDAQSHSFDVLAYLDTQNDPPQFNAVVVFDFDTLTTPGVYVCEVDAEIDGEAVSFPSASNILIEFKRGVGP